MFTSAFHLAVSKLITDKMQNISYLIAGDLGFIKYSQTN